MFNAAAIVAAGLIIATGLWQARDLLPGVGGEITAAAQTTTDIPPAVEELAAIPIPQQEISDAVTETPLMEEPADDTAIRGHIDREESAAYPPVQELLAGRPEAFGTDDALGSLFTLWDLRYQPGQDTGCNQAREQGLDCLFQRGSWRSLVTLNLPAVLSLNDDHGRSYQVVLASIGDQYAELLLNDQLTKVSLLDLSSFWDGEFLLIWRPLSIGAPDIVPGYRGAEITALREALARIDGQDNSASDPQFFDTNLAQRVRDFQQQHRLEPDAIVGARTQIVLNLVSGASSGPRLTGGQ